MPHIHAYGCVAAHALAISSSASSGRPSHRLCLSDDKLLEVQAHTPYYYAHLDHPLTDVGSLIPSTT